VKLEATHIIDITEFVDAAAIDRIYWAEPYYLAPQGKTGLEAFSVIQAAMEKQDKVALGSLMLHQRERPCALEPRDDGMLLTTLRTHDEIRNPNAIFNKHLPKPGPGMLQIAEKIIAQQQAKFDPRHFKDRYEDALRELIARKKKRQADRGRGARDQGREGRRPDGGVERQPEGRRLAREGRALHGRAEGEERPEAKDSPQARRLIRMRPCASSLPAMAMSKVSSPPASAAAPSSS
jgi:DNA end-binding protein Ku